VVLALLGTLVTALPASALTLFTFQGVVKDVLTRPLANVKVSDGVNSTFTAADGTYALPESSTGNFRLWATRAGIVSDFRDANVIIPTPTVEVDFTGMLYQISGSLSTTAFSSVNGASAAALTITSWTPFPSCVNVTDSRGGGGAATLTTQNGNGSSTWQYTLAIPQGTAAGFYSLSYSASDCSSGAILSAPGSASYLVDNTPPVIDPARIIPADGSNTAFTSQPLAARITDGGGAGVSVPSVLFAVQDQTTMVTSTYHATSFDYSTSTALSSPASLTLGHRYQLTVSAADAAGNQATNYTGFFSVVGVDLATVAPLASIPNTSGAISGTPTARTAAFINVPLNIGSFNMNWQGKPEHYGFGFIGVNVDLSKAVIKEYKAGAAADGSGDVLLATDNAPPSWLVTGALLQFQVRHRDQDAQTIAVKGIQGFRSLALPSLTAPVTNPLTDKIVVSLSETATGFLPNCPAKANCPVWKYPTPDPIEYYISDSDQHGQDEARQQAIDSTNQSFQDAASSYGCDPAATPSCVIRVVDLSDGLDYLFVQDPVTTTWGSVSPDGAYDSTTGQHTGLGGVTYPGTYPLFAPMSYQSNCSLNAGCSKANADSSQPQACQSPCNYNHQTITLIAEDHGGPNNIPSDPGLHFFTSVMMASKYFADADHDDLGMTWDTQASFQRYYTNTHRGYKNFAYEDRSCEGVPFNEPIYNEYILDPPHGVHHSNLKQTTNDHDPLYDTVVCPGNIRSPLPGIRLLDFAQIVWIGRTGYPHSDPGDLYVDYGHNKKNWNGQFTCGGDVNYNGDFTAGCGYHGTYTTDKAVEIQADTPFEY
jgi:hypothetical protein